MAEEQFPSTFLRLSGLIEGLWSTPFVSGLRTLTFWSFEVLPKVCIMAFLAFFLMHAFLPGKKKKNLTFSIFWHLERLGTFKSSSTGSFLFDSSPLNLLYSLHILPSAVRRNQVTFPSLCLEISLAVHPALPPTASAFCAAARGNLIRCSAAT